MAALAKRTVATCDAAGVTLVIVGEPTTPAATDRVVFEVDLVKYERGKARVSTPSPARTWRGSI